MRHRVRVVDESCIFCLFVYFVLHTTLRLWKYNYSFLMFFHALLVYWHHYLSVSLEGPIQSANPFQILLTQLIGPIQAVSIVPDMVVFLVILQATGSHVVINSGQVDPFFCWLSIRG